MKIVTYNIMLGGVLMNGNPENIKTPERLRKIMNVIDELKPDVLGLQETLVDDFKREANGYCVVHELRKKGIYPHDTVFTDDHWKYGTGCALFSKIKPLNKEDAKIGKNIRAVEMKIPTKDDDLYIINVYLSHVDVIERIQEIKEISKEIGKRKYCVIMGDFNAISPKANIPEDAKWFTERMKEKYFKNGKICYDTIQAVLDEGYYDAALHKGASLEQITDMTDLAAKNGNHNIPIRMDYFFVSEELEPYVLDCKPRKDDFVQMASDHFPWEMKLNDDLFNK